jgi:hypothetical protein
MSDSQIWLKTLTIRFASLLVWTSLAEDALNPLRFLVWTSLAEEANNPMYGNIWLKTLTIRFAS